MNEFGVADAARSSSCTMSVVQRLERPIGRTVESNQAHTRLMIFVGMTASSASVSRRLVVPSSRSTVTRQIGGRNERCFRRRLASLDDQRRRA